MKRVLLILTMVFLLQPSLSRADSGREFVMSCTYGVLAGTLVGTATLAFTDKPGDNLKSIARGASLGLYAGILLGFYVIYGVSEGSEEEFDDTVLYQPPKLQFYPKVSSLGKLEGAGVNWTVLNF